MTTMTEGLVRGHFDRGRGRWVSITTQLDEPVDLVATSLNFDHREAAAKEIGGA
jgi:hypothetical protein